MEEAPTLKYINKIIINDKEEEFMKQQCFTLCSSYTDSRDESNQINYYVTEY